MKSILYAEILLACLLFIVSSVHSWDSDDHEIFRLVSNLEASEGKGVTFYKFLNVSKTASLAEINKASRRLSLILHPDKNPNTKDVQARFTLLGVITAILRDEEKRKRYNYFHDNGVPRWKGTAYMYSRWQPGLGFAVCFILGVATLIQYGAQHANYHAELARINKFRAAAQKAAYGARKPTITPTDTSNPEKDGAVPKATGRKKVKISIQKSLASSNSEAGTDADIPVLKSRQERRRLQHVNGGAASPGGKTDQGYLNLIVDGDGVWIIAEDGSELPLNEAAASKPAMAKTFIPSALSRLMKRFVPQSTPSPETPAVTGDVVVSAAGNNEESPSGSTDGTSAVGETPKLRKRKGAKLNK